MGWATPGARLLGFRWRVGRVSRGTSPVPPTLPPPSAPTAEVLYDEELRRSYDREGPRGVEAAGGWLGPALLEVVFTFLETGGGLFASHPHLPPKHTHPRSFPLGCVQCGAERRGPA